MAKTYTQLYVQFVFAVQNRQSLILPVWENELQKYITGIVQNHEHKLIAINGIPNHQHVLVGMDPKQSCSKLMELVKANSSKWINKQKLAQGKFDWQDGFGAFSYSRSQIPNVCRYIENQKQHHQNVNFRPEYIHMLKRSGVDYASDKIFHEVEFDNLLLQL
jgi:putative transposase